MHFPRSQRSDRRTFLKVAGAGVAAAAVGGCQSAGKEAAGLTIIDTHTHFYDPTRPQGVPWPPKGDALLYRKVLPTDYRALPKPQPVAGTVVVEASVWVEDNQWILDLAARDPFIVGFVGNLPLGTPEFAGHLKRFAANRLFRGLRVNEKRLLEAQADPQFRADLKRLADQDLALDLLGSAAMLAVVPQFARENPALRLVIDHVANTKSNGQTVDAGWKRGMEESAKFPNVFCKVSGLVEGTGRRDGDAPRSVEFYRPVLDTIWSAFGEDRLIYGSNWPVSERFATCATVQGIVYDYFSAKGTNPRAKVFSRNAKTAYKWVDCRSA